jgi:heme exporter protein D
MDLGNHWEFIVAAYCLAVLVIGGLIAWIATDYRAQLRMLADLEARGLRRRSKKSDGTA